MGNVNKIMQRINDQKLKELERGEMKRGEIWYIDRSAQETTGSEQEAGRPAIIVSNDIANKHSGNITVVYLTTQPKTSLPTYVTINSARRLSTALCECVVTVSKERVSGFYASATPEEMKEVDNALRIALDLAAGRATEPHRDDLEDKAQNTTPDAEKRLNEANSAYRNTLDSLKETAEQLEQEKKRAAFYKKMYDDLLQKAEFFATGRAACES